MKLFPCTLREANAYVLKFHRHHKPVRGMKFALLAHRWNPVPRSEEIASGICGAAIVGRPVSRRLDDGLTLEVTRVATDGTFNACSFLYGACWRAARALGYIQLVTYTLDTEPGDSLRGAGWRLVGRAGGGSWSRSERPRVDTHPLQGKMKWVAS
jgi:hypothetical protein